MTFDEAKNLAKKLGLPSDQLKDLGELYTFGDAIYVTPEQAAKWLEERNKHNRKPKSRLIARLRRDIEQGYWRGKENPQGIIFMADGTLADGQNRLMALIQSGKTIPIRISLGMKSEVALTTIDTGVARTSMDGLGFLNIETENKTISALKFFVGGLDKGDTTCVSPEILRDWLEKYKEECEFATTYLPLKAKNVTAGCRGAVMRVYNHHKKNPEKVAKIVQFCEAISTGMNIVDKTLSDFYLKLARQGYGGSSRKDLYSLTQQVLNHFINESKKRFRKMNTNKELFPLVGEN